jgi:hypothetical protein
MFVPSGYEAYARVFHPVESIFGTAHSQSSDLKRWADVAASTGRVMHARAQWHSISPATSIEHGHAQSHGPQPEVGNLHPADLSTLVGLLAHHTSPDDECTFAVWEGYSWMIGAGSKIWANPELRLQLPEDPGYPVIKRQKGLDMSGAHFSLPDRDYVLWTGELYSALKIGDWPRDDWFEPQSPNLMWPTDRSWCVATEIDFDSTLVGGSRDLIEEIVASAQIEAWEAHTDDSLTIDGDTTNR